jgi:Zn-dependent metalloprotease
MCTCGRIHPIYCILPPHILRSVVEKGDDVQRKLAMNTLSIDQTIRQVRATIASVLTGPAARRMAAVMPPSAAPSANRTIRDGQRKKTLPGKIVRRTEGKPKSGDAAVDEAYEGLGATFDLFYQVYNRNSIDAGGMALDATVHYDVNYDNAFWDGKQMVFGDGDGKLFNRFTISIDIIGHELAHGVIEKEAGLIYLEESGALNEHIADVFGSLVKQRYLKQSAAKADWLIGAGLLAKKVKGTALRSMKAPGTAYDDTVLGKDPQPDNMKNYLKTNQDSGGVHINSGIPNKAFYLAAMSIGGNAWDKTGRIWYGALLDPLVLPNTDFAQFAKVTVQVADKTYGAKSTEKKAVADAWKAVGIKV